MHYKRWRATGDVNSGRRPALERYWASVERRGPSECWPWLGRRDRDGYGWFSDFSIRRSPLRAHRYMIYVVTSRLPEPTEHVLHRCDNPPCVNPAHLFIGSNLDNIADKIAKGRHRGNPTGNLGDLRRRLTDEDVAAIRAFGNPYYGSRSEIARRYGISREHVRRIQNGTRR